MADNTRDADLESLVVTPGALHSQDGKLSEQALKAHLDYSLLLGQKVNGSISFGTYRDGRWSGNVDGQHAKITAPSAANQEFEVFHGLGRVPIGRIILDQESDGFLKGSGRASWTEKKMKFMSSVGNAVYYVVIV